jgi:heme exporter protein D
MVKPKVPSQNKQQQQSSTSSYLVLAVKVLLVLIIILLLPKLVQTNSRLDDIKRRRRRSRASQKLEYVSLRTSCEGSMQCIDLIPEEASACVTECVSPVCHEEIYAMNLLEPGEVDIERAKEFEICVKKELRMLRKTQARGGDTPRDEV